MTKTNSLVIFNSVFCFTFQSIKFKRKVAAEIFSYIFLGPIVQKPFNLSLGSRKTQGQFTSSLKKNFEPSSQMLPASIVAATSS